MHDALYPAGSKTANVPRLVEIIAKADPASLNGACLAYREIFGEKAVVAVTRQVPDSGLAYTISLFLQPTQGVAVAILRDRISKINAESPDLVAVLADPGNRVELLVRFWDTFHNLTLTEQTSKALFEQGLYIPKGKVLPGSQLKPKEKIPLNNPAGLKARVDPNGAPIKGCSETLALLALRPRVATVATVCRMTVHGLVTPQTLGAILACLPEQDVDLALELYRMHEGHEFAADVRKVYANNDRYAAGLTRVLDNLPCRKGAKARPFVDEVVQEVLQSAKVQRTNAVLEEQLPFLVACLRDCIAKLEACGSDPARAAALPRDLEAILACLATDVGARGKVFEAYSKAAPLVKLPNGRAVRANLAEDLFHCTNSELFRAFGASQFVTYSRCLRLAKDQRSLVRTLALIRPHMAAVRKVYETLASAGVESKSGPLSAQILNGQRRGNLGQPTSAGIWSDAPADNKSVPLDSGVRDFLDLLMQNLDSAGAFDPNDPSDPTYTGPRKMGPGGPFARFLERIAGKIEREQQPIFNTGFLGRQDILLGLKDAESMPRYDIHGKHYFHGLPDEHKSSIRHVQTTPSVRILNDLGTDDDWDAINAARSGQLKPYNPEEAAAKLSPLDMLVWIPVEFSGPWPLERLTLPKEVVPKEAKVPTKTFEIPEVPPECDHELPEEDALSDFGEEELGRSRASAAARAAVAAMRAALRLERQAFQLHGRHRDVWARTGVDKDQVPHYNPAVEAGAAQEDARIGMQLVTPLDEEDIDALVHETRLKNPSIPPPPPLATKQQSQDLVKQFKKDADKMAQEEIEYEQTLAAASAAPSRAASSHRATAKQTPLSAGATKPTATPGGAAVPVSKNKSAPVAKPSASQTKVGFAKVVHDDVLPSSKGNAQLNAAPGVPLKTMPAPIAAPQQSEASVGSGKSGAHKRGGKRWNRKAKAAAHLAQSVAADPLQSGAPNSGRPATVHSSDNFGQPGSGKVTSFQTQQNPDGSAVSAGIQFLRQVQQNQQGAQNGHFHFCQAQHANPANNISAVSLTRQSTPASAFNAPANNVAAPKAKAPVLVQTL